MRQYLVYDLPMRLFHWMFAGLFIVAFTIAKTIDDDSVIYNFHMLSGLGIGFLVILRVVWGFCGSKHSRFSGFSLNIKDLFSYFKGFLTGDLKKWSGHNPASSWASILMMTLALSLGLTGFLMTTGTNKEEFEDLHEIFANSFMVLAILHTVGIVLHTIRHRDWIGLSMIDGKKSNAIPSDVIKTPYFGVAVIFIFIFSLFGFYLISNYDVKSGSLNLYGIKLQLGDKELNEKGINGEVSEKNGEDQFELEDED